MTKRNKIKITVLAVILLAAGGLIAGWFLWTFNGDTSIPKDFLTMLPATKEQKDLYGNRNNKKSKKQIASCQNPQSFPIKVAKSVVDSSAYKQMWGYIDDIEKMANGLKVMQTAYDIFGDANPDAVRETLPYFMEKSFEDIMALPKEANLAMIDAMCDPSLEWETKFWLSQLLGERNASEALPLFREIAGDEDEPFSLRVSSMDQIRRLQDRDASNLMVELLDNNDDIIRNKASSSLRYITDQGDERVYEIISSHFYDEKNEATRECLLGSMIVIGGEQSIPEIREILKTATSGEKDAIAILLEDVHSEASFELLKDMYNLRDEDLSNLVIGSLAKLEIEEANEFLYRIIEEVNGSNSMMAASYLIDQQDKEVIPFIEKALEKETNEEFIKCYRDMLKKADQ